MRLSTTLHSWLVLATVLIMQSSVCEAQRPEGSGIELFVQDGQVISHPFRIFVSRDISPDMQPRLSLYASHTFSAVQEGEKDSIKPFVIARNQISTETVAGQRIQMTGTLLLFDLQNYPVPPYKGMIRLSPILRWTESTPAGPTEQIAVASHEVNLGNIAIAAAWAVAIAGMLVTFIVLLAKRAGHPLISFFTDSGGRMSLSRTQVALWTLAIGVVVGGYGLLRLQVPDIPATLVALMAMSLATGGIGYISGERQATSGRAIQPVTSSGMNPRLCDLVCVIDESGKEQLSLARAQMVFWTGLTVVLFMTKSALDGVLWDIPWEMVALMGMSQAAYLSSKQQFGQSPKNDASE